MLRRALIGLLVVLFVAYGVSRAQAQALPVSPFSVAGGAVAAAAASWGTASLIVNGAGSTAVAVGGGFLGLTPIGWAGIGLLVLASVLLVGEGPSQRAVVVSTQSADVLPNPDVVVTPSGPVSHYRVTYFSSSAVLHINVATLPEFYSYWADMANCTDSGTGAAYCYGPGAWANTTWTGLTAEQQQARVAAWVSAGRPGNASRYAVVSSYVDGSGATRVRYSYNTVGPYSYTDANWSAAPQYSCSPGSTWDESTQRCLLSPPSLSDGVCRVSWDSSGCPVKNPFDPDCAGLILSCGSSTVPPSVTVTDPATGRTVTTSRPATSGQGVVGTVTVRERSPDPNTGTTTERVTTTTPSPTPGQPPATAGVTQSVYPGTGTSTGTAPLGQVAVANWPEVQRITGEVTCTNCSPADTVKVDSEGHSVLDVPDPDAAAAALAAQPGSFLDELKAKLNPLASFAPPAHAAQQCPAFSLGWHAWSLDLDVSSSSLCTFLEAPAFKSFLQSALLLLYTLLAVAVVLGA